MTVISLIQPQDVAALKCTYFQLVKSLKEIDWYGIDCNTQDYVNNIESGFVYLEILNSGCELTYQLECEIKAFIKKNSSFCVFSDDKCDSRYEIIELGVPD